MIFAVDRLEGAIAVLEAEDGRLIDVPLADLPEGTRQGSILRNDAKGGYFLDADEEARRRHANFLLQESLFD